MDERTLQRLQSDWYSPTRLHDSPVKYDFPGDRFIPNRSLMDLDQAHSLLTNRTKEAVGKSKFGENYRKMLQENLTLDTEGRPFKMLVFRGSPKTRQKSCRLIDEIRRSDASIPISKQQRRFPQRESRILDAPELTDDYYTNPMDWGNKNVLAVVLGSTVYTLNMSNRTVRKLFTVESEVHDPLSVSWSEDGKILAVGHLSAEIQLWDVEASKRIRILEGHVSRVGALAWSGKTLTSGSKGGSIINHDVRASNSLTCRVKGHKGQVCGLKWSETGNFLASGGNDNQVYIWNASKMSSKRFTHRLSGHTAGVKALGWCPYDCNVLASGGGTGDGCIKLWNIQNGTCIKSVDTKSQVCSLLWNRHHKEILTAHGYSGCHVNENQLCLWKYPSMLKAGESTRLTSRVLHLTQSPDGLSVISAGGDECIRKWEIFGPPQAADSSRNSGLDSLLSLKTSLIR